MDGLVDILPDYDKLAGHLALRRKSAIPDKRVNDTAQVKEHEPRNGKCRLCKSEEHNTPRLYRGEIDYVWDELSMGTLMSQEAAESDFVNGTIEKKAIVSVG